MFNIETSVMSVNTFGTVNKYSQIYTLKHVTSAEYYNTPLSM